MKKISIFILVCLQITGISAQNQDEFYDIMLETVEDLFSDEEKEYDPEMVADELISLSEQKININKAGMDELLQIPFLSEGDAYRIIQHRQMYGRILSVYELRNIPELSIETIRQMLPFITTESAPKFSLKESLKKNKNQLLLRYDRFFRDKKGYISKDTVPNKKYVGDPNYYYIKYSFQASDKIQFGLTAEKDAGEQCWGKYNKVFDFYSFHFQLSNIRILERWVVGDYKATFGQGLVIGTNSMLGKSANVLNSRQRNSGLQKYSSIAEYGYLRGTGATFRLKALSVSAFYSRNKIDANLEDNTITSFKTDGLHRIEREIEKKRSTSEEVAGGNLNFKRQHFSVGGTFVWYRYGNILEPAEKTYNLYKIRNTDNYWNGSFDYTFRIYRMNFFGEFARDKKGGWAILNGVNIYPTSRFGMSLLHRYYTPDYQANYAGGFGENSRIENEKGLYVGVELNPIKRIRISAYADVYYFAWVKYNLNKPSSGSDFLTNVSYNPSFKTQLYLRYKYKTKEKNHSESKSIVFYETNSMRFGVRSKFFKQLESHTILDGNSYSTKFQKSTYGWLVAQDLSYTIPESTINIAVRYAYFQAPAYENRLYLYEKDVLYAFSIPAYYGTGHRIYFNLRWKPLSAVTCYLRFATYIYTDDRTSTGSGLEEMSGKKSSNIKCLIKYVF